MIPVNNLKKTCDYCPSQWEFTTFDNRPVYVRYRWGNLIALMGEPNQDINSALNGILLIEVPLGDEMDGVCDWSDVEKELNLLTKESILSSLAQ